MMFGLPPFVTTILVGWPEPCYHYSTTICIFDPRLDAWHILWINPPNGYIIHQLGRKIGNEILQTGEIDEQGQQSLWVYWDIQPDNFRGYNEKTVDQGKSCKFMQERNAKRTYP